MQGERPSAGGRRRCWPKGHSGGGGLRARGAAATGAPGGSQPAHLEPMCSLFPASPQPGSRSVAVGEMTFLPLQPRCVPPPWGVHHVLSPVVQFTPRPRSFFGPVALAGRAQHAPPFCVFPLCSWVGGGVYEAGCWPSSLPSLSCVHSGNVYPEPPPGPTRAPLLTLSSLSRGAGAQPARPWAHVHSLSRLRLLACCLESTQAR